MKRITAICSVLLLSLSMIGWTTKQEVDIGSEASKEKSGISQETTKPISKEENRRVELYAAVMREAFRVENGGNKFIAVKLDTLEGLSKQEKEEVMKKLTNLSPNVYNFEDVKNDNSKFKLDDRGRLVQSLNGTLLWVEVEDYSKNKAIITGVSWFGNLGAVFPKYEATFENGQWQLKKISMAIS